MTVDVRLNTDKARREVINKHLYRDHGGLMSVPGETLAERFERHASLHAADAPRCGHDHESLEADAVVAEFAHYYGARPLRVRTDRPPKKWTITWHLARYHNERVLGGDLEKIMFHESLHDTPGDWAGDPIHRHPDLSEPEETIFQ